MLRTTIVPFLLATLGACRDSPSPDESLAQGDFLRELSEATCETLARCGVDPLMLAGPTCADRIANLSDGPFTQLGFALRAVSENKASYDPVAAQTCVEQFRSISCAAFADASADSSTACRRVFVGRGPNGAACTSPVECVSGRCDFGAGACPGACAPPVAVGGACTADTDCVATSGSDRVACDGASCVVFTPPVDLAIGEACATPETGDRTCVDGAFCSIAGVCTAEVPVGGACDATEPGACADSAFCVEGTCRRPTIAGAGQPCSLAAFMICDPFANLACRDGACVRVGDGSRGSGCVLGISGVCTAPLVCLESDPLSSSGMCGDARAAGDECGMSEECASGTCGDDGRCAAMSCSTDPPFDR